MGIGITTIDVLEGENPRLVAQLSHNDGTLLTLEDVTTWGIHIHRVGESVLSIYSLVLQSPSISMFENDVASVSSVSSGVGTTDTATFTRASGSWIDDRYFAGLSITVTGFASAAEGNGTFVISSVTDTVLTVIDTGDVVVTPTATVGTVVLTDLSSRDPMRLIDDALWKKGGDPAGHNFQYVIAQSDLTPNEFEGNRNYEVTFEFDCSDVAGKNYGDEFAKFHVRVHGNQAK